MRLSSIIRPLVRRFRRHPAQRASINDVVFRDAMPRWINLGTPCPVCAVDIGEHFHSLRDDGALGAVLITPDQYEQFGLS